MVGTPLQEWLEPPKNTTVPEGRDAVLACRVRNKVADLPDVFFLALSWDTTNEQMKIQVQIS